MVENELKYVLRLDSYNRLASIPRSAIKTTIYQGYDSRGARFRKEVSSITGGGTHLTFNYKFQRGDIFEEFEMMISDEEFERCYPLCDIKLEKDRYLVVDQQNSMWGIDFFKNNGSVYFAMAECEMTDETQTHPDKILPFVEETLLYSVPRVEFNKYSSFKISDVQYAENQLTLLMK